MTVAVRSWAWLAFLVLALHQLHGLDLDLAPPGVPAGPEAVAGVVMVPVRLVALCLGWYLVAATLLTLLGVVAGAARTRTSWLVPRTVHEALRQLCGVTIALSAAVPTLAAGADERSAITVQRLSDEAVTGDAPAITMRRIEPPATVAPPSARDAAADAESPAPARQVIDRGGHLWAVAESTLRSAWGAPPTDAEIDPYWRELIRQNRSRLPDPTNPDLVHPGLEVELPPVPARDV